MEITIDNSRQYDISDGNLAHSYTNDTQTMWNGILGEISLRAVPEIDIDRIEVHTIANGDSVCIRGFVNNSSKKSVHRVNFSIAGTPIHSSKKISLKPGVNIVETTLPVSSLQKWNEFNPQLYTASIEISGKYTKDATFGIRTIDNKNGLRINDIPVFLRGTLECCVFPLTGAPATDTKGWKKTFATAREWGLNHLRFHSWCPPEAAFEVADSLGFYLQVELPVWSLKIGDDPRAEKFLKDEYENIIRNYGNHPSFCLLSIGNELQHDFNWLNATVREMKQRDPRHIYTTTSFTFERGHGGHPEPEDEFFVTQWTDNGWVCGQGVFETESPSFNADYSERIKDFTVPLISHEIGQYAVFPSMDEINKYNGTLNPLNFKFIKKNLTEKGLLSQSRDMTLASANLAALMYKEEIERALKTKGMSGFQLLGLQDFPGQGTALVGLIDAFWDNKGAVSPEWFCQFCSPVTPLLNYESAIYRSSDTFDGEILLANFSDKAIT
ncbi:MAG: glycoside hydrolase family 2, partial [Bacteroides sp.]|nr:glycoside hydrolase family 2 [Bacteroides sp.]